MQVLIHAFVGYFLEPPRGMIYWEYVQMKRLMEKLHALEIHKFLDVFSIPII